MRSHPTKAHQVRVMCAYDEDKLRVDGTILTPGDVVRFFTSGFVLEQGLEPEVFSKLREPHLVRPEDAHTN